MKCATRHLHFPYKYEPLGECVYKENTSGKCHVPRYPTRKHCKTDYFIPHLYLENLQKFSEKVGNPWELFLKIVIFIIN